MEQLNTIDNLSLIELMALCASLALLGWVSVHFMSYIASLFGGVRPKQKYKQF